MIGPRASASPRELASTASAPRRAATAALRPRSELLCGGSETCRLSFLSSISYVKRVGFQVFVEGDDIVGAYPAGGTDGKSLLGPLGEFARGLVVAAGKSSLCRGEIGVGEIVVAAIRHRQRRIGAAVFWLLDQRSAQERDRLVRQLGVMTGDQRLCEQDLNERWSRGK